MNEFNTINIDAEISTTHLSKHSFDQLSKCGVLSDEDGKFVNFRQIQDYSFHNVRIIDFAGDEDHPIDMHRIHNFTSTTIISPAIAVSCCDIHGDDFTIVKHLGDNIVYIPASKQFINVECNIKNPLEWESIFGNTSLKISDSVLGELSNHHDVEMRNVELISDGRYGEIKFKSADFYHSMFIIESIIDSVNKFKISNLWN